MIHNVLGRVPPLAWYLAGGVLAAPWIVRYFLAVLGQGCSFILPPVGGGLVIRRAPPVPKEGAR
jgi:hypothetical protein